MRCVYLLPLLLLAGCSRPEPRALSGETCRRTVELEPGLLPEDVEFTQPEDAGDSRLFSLCSGTVGRAVYDGRPLADSVSVAPASLAVITWNTRVGGADLSRFVRDLRNGRFTGGDSVHHFVLLHQEVYRASDDLPRPLATGVPGRIEAAPPGGPRRDIVEAATSLGLSFLYVPSMRNGAPGTADPSEDRGNAILSTLPLDDPSAIEL